MAKKLLIIDAATIFPGKGGAGGGIWSYCKNLLLQLDQQGPDKSLDIICLANREFPLELKNIRVKKLNWRLQWLPVRLFYIHLYLPLFCLLKGGILHKLYFETPVLPLTKTVVTIHDCMADFYLENNYYTGSKEKLLLMYNSFLTSWAVKRAALVFTPSAAVKEELIRRYKINPDKVSVTHLAASSSLQKREKVTMPSGKPIHLFCIAALHRHKGQLKLVDVFSSLLEKYKPDVKLFLRGHIHDKNYYDELLLKIKNSSFADNIQIVEYNPSVKLQAIYEEADCVILLSEYEGFGLPLIEAQENGVPVICSDISVFREVGNNSVLYLNNRLCSEKLADSIYNFLSDTAARSNMIERGFSNLERFSWEKFGVQMKAIYNQL